MTPPGTAHAGRTLAARRVILIALCLMTPALLPVTAAIFGSPQDPVTILVARSADGLPEAAAEEARALLRNEGRLRHVEIIEASTVEDLLALVAVDRAPHLAIVAHGTPRGITVGDGFLAWSDLREALEGSHAQRIYLGACYSEAIGVVAGKDVRTVLSGEVDRRIVGPQIASDIMRAYPSLDLPFEGRFLAYIEANGGLEHYAILQLVPQEPLASPPECNRMLEEWYAGTANPDSRGECVYYLSSASTNCHDEVSRHDAPCTEFTPQDQTRANQEATPSSSSSYGGGADAAAADGGGPGAGSVQSVAWQSMANALTIDYERGNGDDIKLRIGKDLKPSKCATILSLEMFVSGGLSELLKRAVKAIADSTSSTIVKGDGSLLALRLCGSFKVDMPRFASTPQNEAQIRASGTFDIRASAYGHIEVNLFGRFSKALRVGFDTGLNYPVVIAASGGVRQCYRSDGGFGGIHYAIQIPLTAGGVGFFAQAQAGWVSLGYRHEFSDKWAPTFEATSSCPSGTTLTPPSGTASGATTAALALPPVPDVYQVLIDQGLAVENPEPTRFEVEPGQRWSVVAGFLEVRPGSGTYNAMLAEGSLEKLGIPEDLPLGALIVLDLTHPRVEEALGLANDATVPRVSLVDGVALIGGATTISPAIIAQCTGPIQTSEAASLYADVCVGAEGQPVPVVRAGGTYGVVVPGADADTDAASGPVDAQAASTYALACGGGLVGSDPSVAAACQDLRTYSSAADSSVDLQLLSRIHEGFDLLGRPVEAAWFISGCAEDFAGEGLSGGFEVSTPVVGADGSVQPGSTNVYGCMGLDLPVWSGVPLIAPVEVVEEFHQGNLILANLAAGTGLRADAAASKPAELLNNAPDITGLTWRIICAPLGICHLDPEGGA